MKKTRKNRLLSIVGVFILIAFILSFQPVADQVGKVVNKATGGASGESIGERIATAARRMAAVGLGVFLVVYGVAALATPFIGIPMLVIGLAALAWGIWPLFRPKYYPKVEKELKDK